MINRLIAGASGLLSGCLGGLNGVAGSIINIPILTGVFKLSQHQAHGTTAVAALASSSIGSYSFYRSGGGLKSVDVPAAALIGSIAMGLSPVGVMIGQRLSQRALLFMLSGVLLSAPPLLVLKQRAVQANANLPDRQTRYNAVPRVKEQDLPIFSNLSALLGLEPSTLRQSLLFSSSNMDRLALVGMGGITGLTSGFFGVGGGIILVPVLSLYSDNHQVAVGTSLAAMIPPLVMSALMHRKVGNVASPNILLPLIVGSGIGAAIGSRLAMRLTDGEQRITFSLLMLVMACRNVATARKLAPGIWRQRPTTAVNPVHSPTPNSTSPSAGALNTSVSKSTSS